MFCTGALDDLPLTWRWDDGSARGDPRSMRNLLVFVLCASVGSLGCAIHSSSQSGATTPSTSDLAAVPPGADPALIVRNGSDRDICFVNFSPSQEASWGPERLSSSETVAPGQLRGWRVPADAYDLRVEDCQENVIADNRSLAVAGKGLVVTYR